MHKREGAARTRVPGAKLDKKEKKHWTGTAMVDFYKGKEAGKRRPKALMKNIVRAAAKDCVRIGDNALRAGLNLRFAGFKLNSQRILELIQILASGELTLGVLCRRYAFLAWWCDRAAQQFAASLYLQYHEKLLHVNMTDFPCHSLYNGFKNGLTHSGHMGTYKEAGLLANWSSGHYGSDTWLATTSNNARDLYATIGKKDRFFRETFPDIKEDLGLEGPTDEAAEDYLAKQKPRREVPRSLPKGEMSRNASWFGPTKAMKHKTLPNWHTWLLLFVYIGMH